MKKILITGANSYIGTSVDNYLAKWPGRYKVDTLDMEKSNWEEKNFCGYDTVFHVAGIAHSDTRKITSEIRFLYKKVNTQLTIYTATKAKREGVKQFIFMSSSVVYGAKPNIGKTRIITNETKPNPDNCYGISKLEAEKGLKKLETETENGQNFKVVIIRPPMVYGKNSKGNYPLLSKLARKTYFFPNIDNKRSMIYVENLAEFIRLMIENEERGTFYPQNKEYVNTSELVKMIRKVHGKKTSLIKGFTWVIKLLSTFTHRVKKAFSSNYYEQSMSVYKQEYRLIGLEESIRRTEL